MEDLPDDPHVRAVGLIEDYDHPQQGPMRRVRSPYTMRGVEMGPDLPAPALGAQGPEILEEFGFSPERVAELIEAGVLAPSEQESQATDRPAGAVRRSGEQP